MTYKIEVYDCKTMAVVREGTWAELVASLDKADQDGGVGVINVEGYDKPVFVSASSYEV